MPLRFDLAPGEKLYIGQSILVNGMTRIDFLLEGAGPVLRARDVVDATRCDTAIARLYACVQRMYLSGPSHEDGAAYAMNVTAACSHGQLTPTLAAELNRLASTDGFKALKLLRPLIPVDAFLPSASPPKMRSGDRFAVR